MATREEIIRQIVARDFGGASLSKTQVQAENLRLYKAACDKFADWETALKYAGVKRRHSVPKIEVTAEQVLRRMRMMCASGYSLCEQDHKSRDRQFYDAAIYHFGSWKNMLVAVGINLQNVKTRGRPIRRHDREAICEALRRRHQSGLSLKRVDVSLDNHQLAKSAKTTFGSWSRALTAAGLRSEIPIVGPRWNQTKLIAALRQRLQAGKSCSDSAIRADDSPLLSAARYHFGSLRAALERARANDDA